MKLYRSVKLSWKTLLVNKLRTFLALVGIATGVAAVILMVSIGNGAQKVVLNQILSMGKNLLVVNSGGTKVIAGRRIQTGNVVTLKMADFKAILDECPTVKLATPTQDKTFRVKYGNLSMMTKIFGTTVDYLEIRNFSLKNGEFITDEDNKLSRRVAVLGSQVVDVLFKNVDPIGEIIRIGNISFEIIGVLNSKGISVDGANEDNQIIIPINSALRRVFNINYLKNIAVQVKREDLINNAENEIRELLRERHRLIRKQKEDDFNIQNQIRVIETQKETSSSFTTLIVGIAGISLIVGGIGILAVMLITIKERTKEIGLRMAIGARPKDILVQFLSESLILGFLGGMSGVLFGVIVSYGIKLFFALPTSISLLSVFLPFIFSLVVGLIFGVYPARKASLLDPIESLRAE